MVLLFCWYLLLSAAVHMGTSLDSINVTHSLRDGETLVSAGGIFELGFFSPGFSKNRYVGIWYKVIPIITAVWVANREIPLTDSSGVLKIDDRGRLVVADGNDSIIWSSTSRIFAINPFAQLLDSGNFIVKSAGVDSSEDDYLWQSFDYPTDTLLPGMKLGRNRLTALDTNLTSWRAPDDLARGNYMFGFSRGGYPEMIITRNSLRLYRLGPWNGVQFSGTPVLQPNLIFTYGFTFNQDEVFYSYELVNSSTPSRMVISQNGLVEQFAWIDKSRGWSLYLTLLTDDCDRYRLCGAYGSCNIENSLVCSCLEGFKPKFPRDWSAADWSGGCVRKTPLTCSHDEFKKYSSVKLPETQESWSNVAGYMTMAISLDECKYLCLNKCNCTAYTNLDIRKGGSNCLLWFGDLNDSRTYVEGGQDIYVRMAASELGTLLDTVPKTTSKTNIQKRTVIIISCVLAIGLLTLTLGLVLYWQKKSRRTRRLIDLLQIGKSKDMGQKEDELTFFDLATIAQATSNFSVTNKLGEGGFGPVYKGILKDRQEIAVKKLSKNSRQGLDEFKNEVMYIAKLQHRNLVKMLGCCIQNDERMLVYEFMPNKSLDFFIFDETQSALLDWPKRYQIINGIARGLLYLHQDSRLKIIHRDLKAGNILLDSAMNPKISDFGLARSFGGNETEANTNKVVGTFGYMSPEYAIDGIYSTKSDVFSFGVMVLEIVSGKRNRGFYHPEHYLNLLGHAWKLYKEGRCSELIQAEIVDQSNQHEAIRSIKVGLLCVQRSPEQRPNMSTVILMLGGDGELPEPAQPGFFTEREITQAISSSFNHNICSPNGLTVSLLEAR